METRAHNGYFGIRVVVLGASGFIGRWVARKLNTHSAKLNLVVRNKKVADRLFASYDIKGKIFEVDLADQDMIVRLFRTMRPSITFNLAGYGVDRSESDEKTAYQINAHLVKKICEAVTETRNSNWLGQDIVHVGSALEYGEIGGNLAEDSVPNPTTLYGKSKLTGTYSMMRYCENHGLKSLTARLFTVYGPGENPGRLLPSLLETARSGNSLHLTAGSQKRDFTYVEDVAEGLLRLGLITAMPGEIVNLATGRLISVRMFAETAAKILQIPYSRLKFGSIPTRDEEMHHSQVALDRLRQLIAWVPPTGIAEGIRKTLDFENATGS